MAEVIYQDPVKEVRGAMEKGGTINRRKVYRNDKGRVVHEGTPEVYRVKHPRNWETNPPQGEELKKINRFREACRLTKEIMQAANADDTTQTGDATDTDTITQTQAQNRAALKTQYDAYKTRFQKQLRRTADPQAPRDPKTGKPKHYYRLDNFIRAMIYQALKSTE